ncbi:MAG: nucleotidyl transferase AbiEii/AbiGii toxin family protein [Patescibacteria group bacterium]|nr:nucleotidyl transferase AbiEii/AbiGii toxin family protein [Patescibacteria group bacterium]
MGIKAEKILQDLRTVRGFSVPSPELLFILKLVAWLDRRASAKGRKDLIDLISLLETQKLDRRKLKHQGIKTLVKELKLVVSLPELNLNQYQLARAKKNWLLLLDA